MSCSQGTVPQHDMSLLRLRHYAQVRFGRLPPVGVFLLRVFVRYLGQDDDVLARLPIHRCSDLVLGGELDRIEHA